MFKRALTAALIVLSGPLCAAELIGSFTWEWATSDTRFGGISGIEVSADGAEFTAVSDHGFLLNGSFARNGGRIVGVSSTIQPIKTTRGVAVTGNNRDAEGLAIGRDGTVFISFEGNHRVASQTTNGKQVTLLPRHETFKSLQRNSGLEGLAVGPNGALYTLPERSGGTEVPFPLFRFSNGTWSIAAHIPRKPPFLPVGLDFGPDGTLFLLERHLSIVGFQSRVRSFDLSRNDLGEKTEFTTGPRKFDNLEGISAWTDTAGRRRLTLVSDDNYKSFQRTELVEYRLD